MKHREPYPTIRRAGLRKPMPPLLNTLTTKRSRAPRLPAPSPSSAWSPSATACVAASACRSGSFPRSARRTEELRRRLVLIHQHYVELAKQIVGRLEQFDGSVREIVQEAHVAPSAHEDAQTAALVQRLAEQQGAAGPSKTNGADQPNA